MTPGPVAWKSCRSTKVVIVKKSLIIPLKILWCHFSDFFLKKRPHTPFRRAIRKSLPAVRTPILQGIKCIVVDEVDRLVDVLSKHAPSREVEKRKRHARPIAALLEKVLQAQPDVQVVMRLKVFTRDARVSR